MTLPDFSRERAATAQGLTVCGIDEAGRGPWAGPVVAAAAILDAQRIPQGLNDSKKLKPSKREALFEMLVQSADIGIGVVPASRIDEINILHATYEAMAIALAALKQRPTLALVDGNRAPHLPCAVETVIAGDGKCLSIAAASIAAKVTRDRLMRELDRQYPDYGFASHMGYGTPQHSKALEKFGPCPVHRASFAPVRERLQR